MTTAIPEDEIHRAEEEWHLIARRYRALDRIGRGRLGEVFAATDDSLEEIGIEQRLAIQIIPESVVLNNKLFNKLKDQGIRHRCSNWLNSSFPRHA